MLYCHAIFLQNKLFCEFLFKIYKVYNKNNNMAVPS